MNFAPKKLAVVGVVLIAGALFWLLKPIGSKRTLFNETQVTEVRMSFLAEACENYRRVAGSWPTALCQVRPMLAPYQQEFCFDAWGREFHLLSHTNAPGTIWLVTYGPAGIPGGIGSNAGMVMQLP